MGNNLAIPEQPQAHGQNEPPPPLSQPSQAPPRHPENVIPPDQNFTCEICIEPVDLATQRFKSKSKNCSPHRFCNDCMIKYIQAKLDDNVPEIPCPALNCPELLDPHDHLLLVGQQVFVRWCDVLCEFALMGRDRSYCPNRNCSALIVNECGGTVKKATCPNCKRDFCFQCKLPWHAGFSCEDSGELRDRNDRAFGILVEQKLWKRCPQCHHFVELIEGCQIVKCRCATTFCYRCGAKFNLGGCECRRSCGVCLASFCYKCGRQVSQHWCNCDGISRCCAWLLHTFLCLTFLFSLYIVYFRLL